MTTPATPSDPQPAALPPSPEVNLQRAWDKYGVLLYIILGVLAAGILAKGGWDYLNVQKELGIRKDFAAATTPDAMKTFVANHPGHILTGVAELAIGNNSYATGRFTDALAAYNSAVADLPAGPFQANARVGAAMSLLQSGKTGEAEASLHAILNDTSLLKTSRCEAGYHLATIAIAAGRTEDYQKVTDQVMALDPSNPFSEHAFSLKPPASPIAVPGAIVPAKP